MKHFKALDVSDEVLDVLGANLVLVCQGIKGSEGWTLTKMNRPATSLLHSCSIKQVEGGYILNNKARGKNFFIKEGMASDWELYDSDSIETAGHYYLLSVGDPELEITDWNTAINSYVENGILYVQPVPTINGEDANLSKFNKSHLSQCAISGQDGEFKNLDFIGNVVNGANVVDTNKGSSRMGFFKIALEHDNHPILERDDLISEEGVDAFYVDTEHLDELFMFYPMLGHKGIHDYAEMPKLRIDMKILTA